MLTINNEPKAPLMLKYKKKGKTSIGINYDDGLLHSRIQEKFTRNTHLFSDISDTNNGTKTNEPPHASPAKNRDMYKYMTFSTK